MTRTQNPCVSNKFNFLFFFILLFVFFLSLNTFYPRAHTTVVRKIPWFTHSPLLQAVFLGASPFKTFMCSNYIATTQSLLIWWVKRCLTLYQPIKFPKKTRPVKWMPLLFLFLLCKSSCAPHTNRYIYIVCTYFHKPNCVHNKNLCAPMNFRWNWIFVCACVFNFNVLSFFMHQISLMPSL